MSSHCSAVRHHGPAAISTAPQAISLSLVTTDSTFPFPSRSPTALPVTTLAPILSAPAASACVNSCPSNAPLPTARIPAMTSGVMRGSIARTSSRSSHSAENPGSGALLKVSSVARRSSRSSGSKATLRIDIIRPLYSMPVSEGSKSHSSLCSAKLCSAIGCDGSGQPCPSSGLSPPALYPDA